MNIFKNKTKEEKEKEIIVAVYLNNGGKIINKANRKFSEVYRFFEVSTLPPAAAVLYFKENKTCAGCNRDFGSYCLEANGSGKCGDCFNVK